MLCAGPDPREGGVMGVSREVACRYEIDADDRVRMVGDHWLAFARENDAQGLTREAVVGRPLWDFIAGAETRALYREVVRRVRRDDVRLILPFRCDSPNFRRWMRLVMTPLAAGAIRFDGLMLRKLERMHLGILDPQAPRRPQELPMCSCCKRVHVDSDWLEAEDAIARLHTLRAEPYPRLKQVICLSCQSFAQNLTASERG
jgi:hypothetical protein